jgi:methylated-DNA-protein-cysteine methyltransferase related protein
MNPPIRPSAVIGSGCARDVDPNDSLVVAPVYKAIFAAVRRVPRGRVCTYGEIARMTGASGARQVGYALHTLNGTSRLPWHRIVNARGAVSLPGSSGAEQRLRLAREGVQFTSRGIISIAVYGWVAPAITTGRR